MHQPNVIIPWWRIQYTEDDVNSVVKSIRSEHISLGPVTAEFENKLAEALSVPYVVATTSGSSALLMALISLEIKSGDEVIIPNRTWIAAAHAVTILGAKVVLVDVKNDVPIIDSDLIEEKITSRTKAIIPTALSGRAVNIDEINSIAKRNGVYVVEDAAQSLFSRENNIYSGAQSDIGCFSLSVAKLLPTGQGGFVVTHDHKLYQALKKIRTQGVDDLLNCTFSRFGFNFRYTDLQASIGLTQLNTVNKKIERLNQIYQSYEQGLHGHDSVRLIKVDTSKNEVPLYIEVLCDQRDCIVAFLKENRIQTKAFYPNLNRASHLGCTGYFPNADKFEAQGLILPCGPDQPMENIKRVIDVLSMYQNSYSVGHFNQAV